MIIFMFCGIDFRWSVILTVPLIMGLSGLFLPDWAAGILWIGIVAFGAYLAWSYFTERT